MRQKQKKKTWKIPKIMFFTFLLCLFLLYIKFAYLSLSSEIYGKNMAEFASSRNTVKKAVTAKRGTIYDSDKNSLALNVSSYTIIVSLEKSKVYTNEDYVHDVAFTANALAPILGADASVLADKMKQDKYQVELGSYGKGLTELTKDEIEALNLPGVHFIEDQKRFYPNGNFASYIIGYAKNNEVKTYDDEDNEIISNAIVGELGVESEYDSELSGTDGYLEYQVNKYGYRITGTQERSIPAVNGSDIYLTIDSSIQRFTEAAIKDIERDYSPEWTLIGVMDAKNGDILAASSTPSFDPNLKDITDYENPLISKTYEPGSVMKIYTYMCMMENGVYDGNATYRSGKYEIGEDTIFDWNNNGWGTITFDKGFEYSSNVGIVNLLVKENTISKKQLRQCFEKYGFGEKTGIELSNESSGNINFTYDVEYLNAGFGQGISTTAIQQLQALSIISNNGKMLKPHIVKKIVDPNTKKTTYERKKEESRVASEETVNKMKDLMYNVIYGTDPGTTGYTYRIDGFDIIGKTGTSQIYDVKTGTYSTGDNDYIFSFAGMYPKNNPEIVIYAAIKRPTWGKSSSLYTNVKKLMGNIAKYKKMFTEVTEKQTISYTTKSYINKNVGDVKNELEQNGIKVVIIGDGNKIVDQSVLPKTTIATGERVILFTNANSYKMPSIIGWSRKDVEYLSDVLGLKTNYEGYGYVVNQSIAVSTDLQKDMALNVNMQNKYEISN